MPPTVLEQDATYQNQRFNLRVLVEGIGSMKDEPATWEKLKSGTEKLELYRAALSALHKSEPTVQTAGKIPEADIVLLAMGFVHPELDGLVGDLGVGLDARKNIAVDDANRTTVGKVFAAGDASMGASLVVRAIASGRRAAENIDRFLKGQ